MRCRESGRPLDSRGFSTSTQFVPLECTWRIVEKIGKDLCEPRLVAFNKVAWMAAGERQNMSGHFDERGGWFPRRLTRRLPGPVAPAKLNVRE